MGRTDENYRKIDLVEMIGRRVPGATVEFVSVADDPRDYKVSFERIRSTLGFHADASRRSTASRRSPALIESGVLGSVEDPALLQHQRGRVERNVTGAGQRAARMRAVILAGGRGTRLRPFTASFPKPLVPLGDTPVVEF